MDERSSDKPLVWLIDTVKSPPLSEEARIETGFLLRKLQRSDSIGMPHSRPMPSIGRRCNEIRVPDKNVTWRLVYRIDNDAIVIAEVFSKKTQSTPRSIIDVCRQRLRTYDELNDSE